MRGRGNEGKKERRRREGKRDGEGESAGELLVMARDETTKKIEVGNQFRPSLRRPSVRPSVVRPGGKDCRLYLNWGLLRLIGRNDRSVAVVAGVAAIAVGPPSSLSSIG